MIILKRLGPIGLLPILFLIAFMGIIFVTLGLIVGVIYDIIDGIADILIAMSHRITSYMERLVKS